MALGPREEEAGAGSKAFLWVRYLELGELCLAAFLPALVIPSSRPG